MLPGGQSTSPAAWTADALAHNPHDAADKAQRVHSMFTAIADSYDLNNRIHSFGLDQSWRRRAVDLVRVQPTDRVLDAACGTGDLAEAFAAAGAAGVVGVDFAEKMLGIARSKSARARRRPGMNTPTYRRADVTTLPFPNECFDVVSIAFGIRNVADPRRTLAEFRRVLRRRGRLLVLEFSQPVNRFLRQLNHLYCHHIMPLTATLIAGDRSGAYRYLPRSVATCADRERFVAMMLAADFNSVTQHPMTAGVCVAYLGHAGHSAK